MKKLLLLVGFVSSPLHAEGISAAHLSGFWASLAPGGEAGGFSGDSGLGIAPDAPVLSISQNLWDKGRLSAHYEFPAAARQGGISLGYEQDFLTSTQLYALIGNIGGGWLAGPSPVMTGRAPEKIGLGFKYRF